MTRRRRRIVAALLGVACLAGATGVIGPVGSPPPAQAAPATEAPDSFYDPPSPLPAGEPGDVLRAEPTSSHLDPLHLLPTPANVWRLMYLSTSGTGERVAVTGTLLVPRAPWLGAGRRPLLTYALGSHGLGPQCTPSYQFRQGTEYEAGLVASYVNEGWAVVVTDYEHVHTNGFEVYVNTRSAGQSVLDAARAATHVAGSGLTAANPVAITGYSQGGHASSAAAELQPTYAPELPVKAVATGGVPADLREVAANVDRTALFGTVPMAVASLHAVYPELSLSGFNATGQRALHDATTTCMPEMVTRWGFHSATELTVGAKTIGQFLDANPDWASRIDEQRLGTRAPHVPALVYHGLEDPWVPYAVDRQLADDWRAKGADVTFTTYPVAEHIGAVIEAIPQVQTWLFVHTTGTTGAAA
ncbi:MAG TPA: lipase family protein [Streptosporangiales bacterium]